VSKLESSQYPMACIERNLRIFGLLTVSYIISISR